jgi:eukaryotic-like serine/threonine-protein kinase
MSARPEALETIGNYAIERSLAHGSMGHVYVARHTLTHAQVALKVLRADLAADAQAEERFLREVRAAAHIGHDGIVKVHDAGRSSDGLLYLAMELLHGDTLEDRMVRLQGERLPLMDLLWHALEPLAAAHAHDIVHRDLKPANVFIASAPDGSERVKLLDFGLARDTREKSGTETGIALGTPYYMSPEQATRPKLVGPASDVWSIGVMMYEVLSGYMPFEGETLHAVVIHSTTSAHVPLAEREPHLDRELCALVEACLQKDPAQRPADATQLLARLSPLLHDAQLRAALGETVALSPQHDGKQEPLRLKHDAMPFADTAISLSPRLLDSEMRSIPRRSARGWWISAFALLLIAGLGFLLALQRADNAGAPVRAGRAASARQQLAPPFQPVRPSAQSQTEIEAPARTGLPPTAALKEPLTRAAGPAPQANQASSASRPGPTNPETGPTSAAAQQPPAAQVAPPTAAPAQAPAPNNPAQPSAASEPPAAQPSAAAPIASEAPVQSGPPEHADPEPPVDVEPPGLPPDDLPPPEPPEPAPETTP